jgi:hypothetical protein
MGYATAAEFEGALAAHRERVARLFGGLLGAGAGAAATPANPLAQFAVPRGQLGKIARGLKIELLSGTTTNARAADDSFDPNDTATTISRAGRVSGYTLVYGDVGWTALRTGHGLIDVGTSLDFFRSARQATLYEIKSLRDLERVRDAVGYDVPVLCKDVIVSEVQIEEARSAGADAVLLIAEALSDAELRRFVELAHQLNMGALVEAHEPVAFGRAVAAGSRVVGINARNLRRPREIDIGRVRQLHTFARPDQVLVAESGIATADDVRLLPSRVDAVLVGTALMRASDPVLLIRAMSAARASRTREIDVREGVP